LLRSAEGGRVDIMNESRRDAEGTIGQEQREPLPVPSPEAPPTAAPPAEWGGDWDTYYALRREFPHRRALVPIEQVEPYRGLMVARAPDASGIIESAPDYDTLWRRVAARGTDPMLVVFESIPPHDHEGIA
jgi:hypothetical protein